MAYPNILIPGVERNTEMTPTEFELFCLELLKREFGDDPKYSFKHNVIEKVHDGDYQIDGEIIFQEGGMNFKILVECKKYTSPIKREKITALKQKMDSIGAQKGIFITTSYYQSGAFQFAKEHGIALVQIVDGYLKYQSRSEDGTIPDYIKEMLPKYVAVLESQIKENTISLSWLSKPGAIIEYLSASESITGEKGVINNEN